MSPRLPRQQRTRRIRARMTVLIALGMLAPTMLMAWAGWRSYRELERRVLAERELVARLAAERLNSLLTVQMEELQSLAASRELKFEDADVDPERTALRRHYVRSHQLVDEVFVLDGQGRVQVDEPALLGASDAAFLSAEAQRAGGPEYTDLIADSQARQRVYALVPVRPRPGEVVAVVGVGIRLASTRLASMIEDVRLGDGESVDVVDGRGRVIASTDPERVFKPADEPEMIAQLLREHRPVASGCRAWRGAGSRREVYAMCPLSIAHWGVKVHQPQGAAFAVIDSLTRNVASLVLVLFAIAFLLAWGASLSLTRPLATLTAAAQRIAEGELGEPIPAVPADEVGSLGASLERMRVALKDSLERVEKTNEELELRVEQRTAELWRLNMALQERDEQRRLALRKVISAQEDERKRIARELHDETTQTLVALVMSLQLAAEKIQAGEGAKKVEDARALAVRTLDEVHRLIVDLRPSVLDDLGLKSAIQWYADRALKSRGVNVRCEFSGLDGRLPFEIETALFRCAQEAMTNIARHSSADAALIQCARRGGRITMEIEDDGAGFDVASLGKPDEKGRGWGILGIRERVELLGGTARIESSPGEGTLVTIDVPAGLEASP